MWRSFRSKTRSEICTSAPKFARYRWNRSYHIMCSPQSDEQLGVARCITGGIFLILEIHLAYCKKEQNDQRSDRSRDGTNENHLHVSEHRKTFKNIMSILLLANSGHQAAPALKASEHHGGMIMAIADLDFAKRLPTSSVLRHCSAERISGVSRLWIDSHRSGCSS